MNRLRSIIALQVYVCMWGVWNAIQDKKRERERIIRFVRMHLMLQERNGSNGGGKKEGKHHQ